MTRIALRSCLVLLVSSVAAACSIVEPNAYLDAEARKRDGATDASDATDGDVADAIADATETEQPIDLPDAGLHLADTCDGAPPPVLRPGLRPFVVSTEGLTNEFDQRRGLQCTRNDAAGNDGFFAIDVEADEKWHFHVTAQDPESNPSIYLLDSTCRADQCQQRFGLDLCGTYNDEHFTIVATHRGRWYLGIDDRAPGSHSYRLNAIRTTCGNNELEHGEACDGGEQCDSQCRWMVATGAADIEPNDDWTVANVMTIDRSGGDTYVLGQIGGSCGFDMYAIDIEAQASLEVTLVGRDGATCEVPDCVSDDDAGMSTDCPTQVPIRIELLAPDGATVLGTGRVRPGSACASIDATDLFARGLQADGVHYVRLWSPEGLGTYEYRLNVRIVPP